MRFDEPSVALLINAVLLFILALYFYRKKVDPLAKILFWLMLAAAWWSLFYGIEFIIRDERFLPTIILFEFVAMMTLPVFWLLFLFKYTGFTLPTKFGFGWLFLVPAINWLILLTNPFHKLFFTEINVDTSLAYRFVQLSKGPVFLFSHFLYTQMLVGAGLMLILRTVLQSKGIALRKALFILLASIFPFILNLFWVVGFRPLGFLDTTPFGFALMGVILVALFNRLSEEELRPLVLDSLFEYQPDALMVTNEQTSQLLYTNSHGKLLFNQLLTKKDSRSGLEYLHTLHNNSGISFGKVHYQVQVKDLDESVAGRKLRLFSFRDVSELKQQEANLSALTKTTATFGNDATENIGKLLSLLGEIFGARSCFYNKKLGPLLVTAASWNAPLGYQDVSNAEGHICNDVIGEGGSEPVIFNDLQQSTYSSTDPNVRSYGLCSYLGVSVFNEGIAVATICLVFMQNQDFSKSELQFLNLVSYVVANEENRQQQRQKLNETEVNLRAILENSLDSIWSVDNDFRVTYVNEVFKTAFKHAFNAEPAVGSGIIDLLPKALQPIWHSRYKKALEGEHFIFLDSVPITDDITIYVEVSVMPIIIDGQVKGISFYGRNITDKYLSEQRLMQSEKRLAELNAAKDRLFSIISHDLRSPFNNIIGLSEVVVELAAEAGNQAIREYATSILRVSKSTFALLENLLHWSRAQSGNMRLIPTTVRLAEIVKQEVAFLHPRLDQKLISVHNKVNADIFVEADAQSLAVMIRNLISNAIKFSYSEGQIILEAEHDNDHVLFRVQDFGCGISIEDQKLLFQLDKNISRKGTQNETGTGLGLILCKELAEKNGGYLLAQSRVGKGSTFTLMLRAAAPNT
jgi:PAS domain S-box-containing protein